MEDNQDKHEEEVKTVFTKKKIIKFSIVLVIWIIWVIWVRNPWWLLGIPILFDVYVTKKVKWAFWKQKKGAKKNTTLEWVDAIIFALVVATVVRTLFVEAYVIPSSSMEKTLLVGDHLFVSKIAYGPKMPNTPLSVPLVHNSIFGSKSYSKAIQWPYKRLAGFGKVKNDDIVVFNFPHGDTVVHGIDNYDYYDEKRRTGTTAWANQRNTEIRPVDKKDNYVKRCIGIPGDVIEIVNGQAVVNGTPQKFIQESIRSYIVKTSGSEINRMILKKIGLSVEDELSSWYVPENSTYYNLKLSKEAYEEVKKLPIVLSIEEKIEPKLERNTLSYFPFDSRYPWNVDNFGPLWVPQKGAVKEITIDNLPLYQRIISTYEGNTLEVKDSAIYINGEKTKNYEFKMDYYFMMGDSRNNSADSRMWGFVPEDHIVGRASFIWLSLNKDEGFPKNIRWNRLFKIVE